MSEEFEPNIVAFLCNWCSYAGADLAGTSRLKYPPNVKAIRVMCSARVNPLFIVNALQQGADGVLISGCWPGDCHYIEGNYFARRRFMLMHKLLEHAGVDPRRINMSWVSASEGAKYKEVVEETVERVKAAGPMDQFRRRQLNW
ncbi:MAG: hydrogenase iron-sulfur subunit [Actinobacteria bacterium]|nr:hydrogenase iron-sulfur subunit [Actinomycetota bacterium]MCG2820227.1 hydrogenase iron-sulfur subunit [Actinomycetes bacterium]MBU4178537.1 hydrogenase iron-sulfur subunit [Actinomycetota bacterium]MBU4219366.1 hydrogenase iron-sulfur subunit [Actinomycetota bacterium]MBU4360093.1 hydrogenase iron-sulfur subunit [Actinomycetota bacterium]